MGGSLGAYALMVAPKLPWRWHFTHCSPHFHADRQEILCSGARCGKSAGCFRRARPTCPLYTGIWQLNRSHQQTHFHTTIQRLSNGCALENRQLCEGACMLTAMERTFTRAPRPRSLNSRNGKNFRLLYTVGCFLCCCVAASPVANMRVDCLQST